MSFNQFKHEMKEEIGEMRKSLKDKEERKEFLYTLVGIFIVGIIVNTIRKRI